MKEVCRLVIPVDINLANPNRIGSLHWSKQRKIKSDLALVARSVWTKAGRPRANGQVSISVIIRRARRLDEDNAWSSLKSCIDAIFNDGITPNDSPKWVTLNHPLHQDISPSYKGKESVEFLVWLVS